MSVKTHPIPEDRFADYVAELNSITSGTDLPHAACCAFLLGSGARIGEALAVRMKDLFAADGSPLERVTRPVEKKRQEVHRLTVTFPWEYLGGPLIAWRRWVSCVSAAREGFLRERSLQGSTSRSPTFALRSLLKREWSLYIRFSLLLK